MSKCFPLNALSLSLSISMFDRGPTVGLEVLEALSDHWLEDDARGEAWLKNRQVVHTY
jgi:hypothetical protein